MRITAQVRRTDLKPTNHFFLSITICATVIKRTWLQVGYITNSYIDGLKYMGLHVLYVMATTNTDADVIENVQKMVGAEYHVGGDLETLHGIKSVVQSRENYDLIITAYDDYPVLSNLQTVCAWHQCGFHVESAGRVDGDIVVRVRIID